MIGINNINIGNVVADSVFIGNTECKDIYIGTNHVYHKEDYKGIGIMLTDNSIIDYSEINTNQYTREDIIGITIQNDDVSIIMSPDAPSKAWFCGGKNSCPSAKVEIGVNGAGSKYIGEEATAAFRTTLTGDQNWAVNKAYNTIINGQHCYLPYQGELRIIYENRVYINELLERCGCSALPGGDYWSSALIQRVDADGNDTSDVNGYLKIVAGINFTSDNYWGLNVQGYYNVLPITKLNIS